MPRKHLVRARWKATPKKKEDDAMERTVTPSGISQGQIGKIQELLGAGLRKSGLSGEPVQQIIEHQGDALVRELVAVVCKRVEAVSNLIVRRVRVNRSRNPQQALDATGRRQFTDKDVVRAMPRGTGEEGETFFFQLNLSERGGHISDDELDKEFSDREFIPEDPDTLAAVNEADPAFADTHPNCTHWKDASGKWCYAAFDRWDDGRAVGVGRSANDWSGSWWFAGRRK